MDTNDFVKYASCAGVIILLAAILASILLINTKMDNRERKTIEYTDRILELELLDLLKKKNAELEAHSAIACDTTPNETPSAESGEQKPRKMEADMPDKAEWEQMVKETAKLAKKAAESMDIEKNAAPSEQKESDSDAAKTKAEDPPADNEKAAPTETAPSEMAKEPPVKTEGVPPTTEPEPTLP